MVFQINIVNEFLLMDYLKFLSLPNKQKYRINNTQEINLWNIF